MQTKIHSEKIKIHIIAIRVGLRDNDVLLIVFLD